MLQYTLDDGKTWIKCPEGIQICLETEVPGEDISGDLVFNFTHEGLICDVWLNNPESSNIGTSSEMYNEIVERLVEENR